MIEAMSTFEHVERGPCPPQTHTGHVAGVGAMVVCKYSTRDCSPSDLSLVPN